MSAIGPELPPHLLAKRKRQVAAPDAVGETAASKPPILGPGEKRRRVIGPAAPPRSLDEQPTESPNPEASEGDSDSDSDDDYGPAPFTRPQKETHKADISHEENDEKSTVENSIKRDGWMMIPPDEDGLAAARTDPTRARPRKFNTGKGSRAPNHGDGIDRSWTETPEEKRKRLADQVMGVENPTASSARGSSRKHDETNEKTAKRIQEHIVRHFVLFRLCFQTVHCVLTCAKQKTRGKSLYDEHRRTNGTEKDDDPSKRAFDREKDIAGGTRIGHAQRKEMLNRASDFGSRFSGGGYL
ncbi:MAG: hypothetical protein M1821_008612 [Bathelium mastoideum]|nr:MAG: hypothetical protein M1821_008612 [Bathelium mastoideum]